jgi:hypothetical protein
MLKLTLATIAIIACCYANWQGKSEVLALAQVEGY